jgi:CRP/FNR family transcriptional regulator
MFALGFRICVERYDSARTAPGVKLESLRESAGLASGDAPFAVYHRPMIATERLTAIPFFAAFPRAALQVIADRAVVRRFVPGETLFRAGESAAGLMVVLEGKVRVIRTAGDRAQVVHVERVGGTLGEVPMFAGGGYPATAVAEEATECVIIARETLAAAVKSSPESAFVLLERLARRVRELVERLDRSALRPVSARLAEFLITRATARGRAVVAIGMTQRQLAEELGTVREVVVRELHALRTAGVVRSLGGGRLEIVDAGALRERAGEDAPSGQKVTRPANPSTLVPADAGDGPRKNLSRRLPDR